MMWKVQTQHADSLQHKLGGMEPKAAEVMNVDSLQYSKGGKGRNKDKLPMLSGPPEFAVIV